MVGVDLWFVSVLIVDIWDDVMEGYVGIDFDILVVYDDVIDVGIIGGEVMVVQVSGKIWFDCYYDCCLGKNVYFINVNVIRYMIDCNYKGYVCMCDYVDIVNFKFFIIGVMVNQFMFIGV